MHNPTILFMGTPDFAASLLQAILKEGYSVLAVVSQPDRPTGRKKQVLPTPVKKIAIDHQIKVYQPLRIRKEFDFVKELQPDIILTCAYGQILPPELLALPKIGCYNIHASLLPQLRGGAPIQRAIMQGEIRTGITIMEMVEKMDAGKMFMQESIPIDDDDTTESLSIKLQELAKKLLLSWLPLLINDKVVGIEQDDRMVTYAPNISRAEEQIDWSQSAHQIHNLVRALAPTPGAYSWLFNEIFKIGQTKVISQERKQAPGTIVQLEPEFLVACGEEILQLITVQPAGKRMMTAREYLRGSKALKTGDIFTHK
jgi:methionyl-tRNA formyltransferase